MKINNRFRIEEKIASGGTSDVYLVEDDIRGESVALKCLTEEPSTERDTLGVEYRTLMEMEHPNLEDVFEFGTVEKGPDHLVGNSYFTSEFIEGENWRLKTAEVSLDALLNQAVAICRALQFVHCRDLIHFDIKPDNVLVPENTAEREAVLVDFCLSENSEAAQGVDIRGTLSYVAPEIIQDEPVDGRSDLYSLGITLYEMVTGELPYGDRSAGEILHYHVDNSLPDMDPETMEVPPDLVQLIRDLMARNPEQRPSSANEVIHRLGNVSGTTYRQETQETMAGYVDSPAFIGRKEELTALKELWRNIEKEREEENPLVLLTGPSGVGKSRLLQEFGVWARTNSVNVYQNKALLDRTEPYGLMKPVLEKYRRHVDVRRQTGNLASDPVQKQSPLLSIVMKDGDGNDPPEERPKTNKVSVETKTENVEKVLDAVSDFVIEGVGDQGGIIMLEDLQWADEMSLRLMACLVRKASVRPDHVPLLVVATMRSEAGSENGQEILGTLRKENRTREISLSSLEKDATERLVESMFGSGGEQIAETVLDREKSGNPMFVSELMRTCVESGAIRYVDGDWVLDEEKWQQVEVPDAVDELLAKRIERLDPREKEFLKMLASWDGRITRSTMHDVFSESWIPAHEDLEELKKRGLLNEEQEGTESYLLPAHDRIVEQLMARMESEERRERHSRLLSNLEKELRNADEDRGEHIGRLARFAREAGDRDKFLMYGEEAANRAWKSYAHREALSFYKQMLSYDGIPDEKKRTFLERTGDLHRKQGNYEEARDCYEKLLSVEKVFPDKRVRLLRKLGKLDRSTDSTASAEESFERALSVAEEIDSGTTEEDVQYEKVGVMIDYASLFSVRKGDREKADRMYRDALEACEHLEASTRKKKLELYIRINLQLNRSKLRKSSQTTEKLRTHLEEAEEGGHDELASRAARYLGLAHSRQNDYEKAIEAFQRAITLEEETGQRRVLASTLRDLGTVYRRTGRKKNAVDCLRRARNIFQEMADFEGMISTSGRLGTFYADQGRYRKAIQKYEKKITLAERLGDEPALGMAYSNIGLSYFFDGRFEQAISAFRQAFDFSEGTAEDQYFAVMLQNMVYVLLHLGRKEEAKKYFSKIEDLHKESRSERIRYYYHHSKGLICFYSDEFDEASDYFQTAGRLASTMQLPVQEGRSRVMKGAAEAWDGNEEKALSTHRNLLTNVSNLENTTILNRVRLWVLTDVVCFMEPPVDPDLVREAEQEMDKLSEDVPEQAAFLVARKFDVIKKLFQFRFRNRREVPEQVRDTLTRLREMHVNPVVDRLESLVRRVKEIVDRKEETDSQTGIMVPVDSRENVPGPIRDPVSGIGTPNTFRKHLKAILPADKEDASPVSVVLIRIDGLDVANRQLGFQEKNRIVSDIGDVLNSIGRERGERDVEDSPTGDFGPVGISARLAGTLFGLCLPENQSETRRVVQEILEKIRELLPGNPSEEEFPRVSAGISSPEGQSFRNVERLLDELEEAVQMASGSTEEDVVFVSDMTETTVRATERYITESNLSLPPLSRERIMLLSVLQEVTSAGLDLEKSMSVMLETLVNVTEARSGFVLLEGNDGLNVVSKRMGDKNDGREGDEERSEDLSLEEAVSKKLVEQAFDRGETLLIQNAADNETYRKFSTVRRLELRSVLVVPVTMSGKNNLAIYLENTEPGEMFGPEDRQFLEKVTDEMGDHLQQVVEHHRRETELKTVRQELKTRYDYENLKGSSPEMQEVFETLDRLIPTELNLILEGETGTGKELVARAIHYNGPRQDKPFLAVNCGRFQENLLEGELFGHKKGAFTGATESQKGLFEQADGGCLFLDEITSMDYELQNRLLRVLETGTVRRIGAESGVDVDVRIICATNRPIELAIEENEFRKDLYYRLNGAKINLPPLRERREDIPQLAHHFLQEFAEKRGESPKQLSDELCRKLMQRSWSGNIRELKSTVQLFAIYSGDKNIIQPEDVTDIPEENESPGGTLSQNRSSVQQRQNSGSMVNWHRPPQDARNAYEKFHLRRALRRTEGNISEIAQTWDISRRAVYNLCEKHDLNPDTFRPG